MRLPCSKKCLKYPICISMLEIECKGLSEYYGEATESTYESGAECWDHIEKVFPKLLEIHGPMIQTKSLRYRAYKIYKYPDPGHLEFKQTPEEI